MGISIYEKNLRTLLDLIWQAIVDLPYAAIIFFVLAIFFLIRSLVMAKSMPQETFVSDMPAFKRAKSTFLISILIFILWVICGTTGFQSWAQRNLKYDITSEDLKPPFGIGQSILEKKHNRSKSTAT